MALKDGREAVETVVSFLGRWLRSGTSADSFETCAGYRLLEKVARGRLSTLYRGENRKSGEPVAVKILSSYGGKVADKLTRKLKKEWEGQRALRLQHPHIVHTIACGKERGRYYIAMEFLEGGTLTQAILANSPAIAGRRIELMLQAASGLEYVHKCGIIHRDICTRNVMLARDGAAKLIDFGVAANKDDRIRNTGQRTGRPSHMAPELIRTNRFDERTDIFAFGVSLYEVVTGQRPFHSRDDSFETLAAVLNADIRPPSQINPAVGKRLEAIILRAIERRRARRYPTVTALLADLQGVTEAI